MDQGKVYVRIHLSSFSSDETIISAAMELEDLCRCKVQQLKSALESLKSLSSTGVLILGRLRTISTRLKKLEKVVEKTRPPDLKKELQNLLECLKLEVGTCFTHHYCVSVDTTETAATHSNHKPHINI